VKMNKSLSRHCPNPECPNHEAGTLTENPWFSPHGWYHCQSDPKRKIRRYRCDLCGKTFSETYFTRYWHLQRRDIDEIELLFEWCKGTSVHDLSERFGCSCKAIENRITRMQKLAESNDIVFEVDTGRPSPMASSAFQL